MNSMNFMRKLLGGVEVSWLLLGGVIVSEIEAS